MTLTGIPGTVQLSGHKQFSRKALKSLMILLDPEAGRGTHFLTQKPNTDWPKMNLSQAPDITFKD